MCEDMVRILPALTILLLGYPVKWSEVDRVLRSGLHLLITQREPAIWRPTPSRIIILFTLDR